MQYITKDYKNLNEEFVKNYIDGKILKVFNGFCNNDDNNSQKQPKLSVYLNAFNAFGENVFIDIKDTISFKLTPYFFMLRI